MKGIEKECDMKLSRWGVFAILVLVLVLAAVLDLDPSTLQASGQASAAKPGIQATLQSTASERALAERFVYFPDQYTNQAEAPAEPMATF